MIYYKYMATLTDEQLAEQYKKGDGSAFEEIVQRYMKPLYNFVFQYVHSVPEAEDVIQEVFVKIWKKIDTYDQSYKFKTWAYTIAKNTALDALKKKGLVPFSEFENGEDGQNSFLQTLVSKEPLPEEAMEKVDTARFVNRAIDNLPEKYKKVLAMRYKEDYTFREISEKWKQSIDTIKTQHRRAIIQLKKTLSDK
jgi:RNA polymerase sigma-70 factor (ECF subfamily)